MRHEGLALWLIAPGDRHRGVLRMMDTYSIRGFSARYGWALAFRRRHWLTRLILAEMNHRPMEEAT